MDLFSAVCAQFLTYGDGKRKELFFQRLGTTLLERSDALNIQNIQQPKGSDQFFKISLDSYAAHREDFFALKIVQIGPNHADFKLLVKLFCVKNRNRLVQNQVDSQLLVGIFRPSATAQPPPAGTVPEPIETLMP